MNVVPFLHSWLSSPVNKVAIAVEIKSTMNAHATTILEKVHVLVL